MAAASSSPSSSSQQKKARHETDVKNQMFDRVTLLNVEWLKMEAQFSKSVYKNLAELCDRYPHRLSGSASLESAIEWLVSGMKLSGTFDRVWTEEVYVPHWTRGHESCKLVAPYKRSLNMLGIGNSVGTDTDGITARVVCVRSWEELDERKADIIGNIVLFNAPFTTYGAGAEYRVRGASRAAAYGAIACLVRSVAPESLATPHTGTLVYDRSKPLIPAACLTIEDAELLQRLSAEHEISVCLKMEAFMHVEDAVSRNVLAEVRGTELPDEIVAFGGHIDSWDVGQGAHDDAQGCIIAWEVLRLFRRCGIRPRRTVRVVMWTNEENGQRGAADYLNRHGDEFHQAVLESDLGVYTAIGFGVSGAPGARVTIEKLMTILSSYPNEFRVKGDGRGVDIRPMIDAGTPGLLLRLADEWWDRYYFRYHHTAADTIDKIDEKMLRQNLSLMACTVYLLSQLDHRLDR